MHSMMNSKFLVFILLLLSVSLVSAANLEVKVLEKNDIIISELERSNATFTLNITNLDVSDDFQIYSLVSIGMYPKEFFRIESGKSIILEVTAVPFKEILNSKKGIYAFEYQIKGKKTGFFKDALAIKLFDIKDIALVSIEDIPLNSSKVKMIVNNKENIEIKNLKITAKSNFFEFSETMDLKKKESKIFEIPIILDEKISAGDYESEIIYELNNVKSSLKMPITRLFTVYSDRPTTSQRNGIFVDYSWEKEMGVGESYTVNVNTNYTIPFIILLLVVLVGLFVRFMGNKKLSIHKGISLVRTKGGEFALKINLRVKANREVRQVIISDRIPGHAKLFNKFGIPPHRIDENARKIEWDIPQLNAGEERVFSYVIYSKINIVGSFELPAASVSFESDGKKEFVLSNKTHFASETTEN